MGREDELLSSKKPSSSPSIAFIMPALADMLPSGVTTFVRQLSDGLAKYGDRFRVVEVPHGEGPEDRRPKAEGRRNNSAEGLGSGGDAANGKARHTRSDFVPLLMSYASQLIRDVRRVWKVRKQVGRRVIVTNQFGCEMLPVGLRVVFPFSWIVAISHTHPGQGGAAAHPVRCLVERLCFWSVNEVLFNSSASRLLWINKLNVKSIPGAVAHLGTEPPELSIPPAYPPKPEGVVDFVCVARFASWKGQMNLVRAWADMKKTNVSARLIFVGDGDCLQEVKDAVVGLGLDETVLFLGHHPRGDLCFNGADVAILASTEPEAFGLVLLEAMSRGLPVAASRLGGIPEIVKDGETGILFDPTDRCSITNAIARLLVSKGERDRLGGNGKIRWLCEFTAQRMVSRFEVGFRLCGTVGSRVEDDIRMKSDADSGDK